MADNYHTSPEIGPYFDVTLSSNVTGLAGETVQLTCRVKNLGNRTVSADRRPRSLFAALTTFEELPD